jgi:hypothetical protein
MSGESSPPAGSLSTVGEGERVRSAHDRDVAGAEGHRLAGLGGDPGATLQQDHQPDRCPVLDSHAPRRLHARTDQVGAATTRSVEQTCQSVHIGSVDAHACK